MTNAKRNLVFGLLIGGLFFLSGCGSSQVGEYVYEIRVKRGLTSEKAESLQPALEAARKTHRDFVDRLGIERNGRYQYQDAYHKYEGDWWIAEDGRLAMRTTHQDGRSLGRLVSQGADHFWEIGSDGNLYRYWNSPDSNLEYVYVKQ